MPVRVSVCMATYAGERFVTEQVTSILEQLGPDDELVIVDDASPDDTVAVLKEITDPRIRLTARKKNLGYVRTFAEALALARGEYLLLSDQDDVWAPEHVEDLVTALQNNEVAACNLATLGGPDAIVGPYGQSDWMLRASDSGHRWRNIFGIWAGNRPYYGCTMGLRAEALRIVLPVPSFLAESHDLWFALYGNLAGSIAHIERRTVLRRFHADNQTPTRPRGLATALTARLRLVRCTLVLANRLYRMRHWRGRQEGS